MSSASTPQRWPAVWVGAAVLSALSGCAVALAADRAAPADESSELVITVVIGAVALVGATVTLSVPKHTLGRLLLATALLWAWSEAMTEVGVRGIHNRSVAGADYYATFGLMLRAPIVILMVGIVPLLFPDGRPATPRSRKMLIVACAAGIAAAIGSLLAPQDNRLPKWHGALDLTGPVAAIGPILVMTGIVGVIASALGAAFGLRARWRREGAVVRQQLLLFASAAAFSAAFLVGMVISVFGAGNGAPRWTFAIAMLPLPVAIAVATLRHGLYDLRRAADRTMLWLTLSAAVVAIYASVVAAATALAPQRNGWWTSALAAGVTALALIPLRDRVQRIVNRVVYGASSEPYAVLARLGEQLAAAADVDRLVGATLAELSAGLDLHDVGVEAADGTLVAGSVADDPVTIGVTAYGQTVGRLTYRRPGRTLSEAEQRLVGDLARQLGGALHARALRLDLQRTRERLVLAREEERRRLRRDLHDGLGPALAGLTLKTETARARLADDVAAAGRQLDRIAEEIRLMVADIRRVVEGLRPPALDEMGLVDACEQAAARLASTSAVRVVVTADELPQLPAAVEVAVFRIVQEAVTNVVRHSDASACTVSLTAAAGSVEVRIADDGSGMRSAGTGHGLSTMRERAEELGGVLQVDATGSGVVVIASIPVAGVPG